MFGTKCIDDNYKILVMVLAILATDNHLKWKFLEEIIFPLASGVDSDADDNVMLLIL